MVNLFIILSLLINSHLTTADIDCISYTECSVDCGTTNCANTIINGNQASSLIILCPHQHSCLNTNIKASYVNDISIECHDLTNQSCSSCSLYAEYSNNVNISCFGSATCNNFNIYAQNVADKIHFNCIGDYSCSSVTLFGNDAHTILIRALGNYALYQSSIHGSNTNSLDLTCSSRSGENACYQTSIYAPSNNINTNTQITCNGYGCNSDLYLFSLNGASDFNITLNGCEECNSAADCINQWKFYCGDAYNQLARFNGDICSNNLCNCDNAITKVNENWINHNDNCFVVNPYTKCNSDTNCIVYCDSEINGCIGTNIDARLSNVLTVTCSSIFGKCEETHIYCPIGMNKKCIINCMEDGSCINAIIYANTSYDVELNCVAENSCRGLNLYGQSVEHIINITCVGENACVNVNISGHNANKIIVRGIGGNALIGGNIDAVAVQHLKLSFDSLDNKYTCHDTNFYVSVIETILYCEGMGCYNMNLYAPNGVKDLKNISLIVHESSLLPSFINEWNIYCSTDYSVFSTFNGMVCDNSLFCDCGSLETLINFKSEVYYDCSNGNNCQNEILDGINSNVLTVYCDERQSCQYTTVYCPNSIDSICNVICIGSSACNRIVVYGGYNSRLNMNCTSDYSCAYAHIYANQTHYSNIICTQSKACENIDIYGKNANILSISCMNGACDYLSINATHVKNKINLYCNAGTNNYGCQEIYLYGYSSKSVVISGIGYNGFASAYIHLQNVTSFDLICTGEDYGYGCTSSHFYLSQYGVTKLHCYGYGCSNLYFYDLSENNVLTDKFTAEINGCGLCLNLDDCINSWDLFCGIQDDSYSVMSSIYGSQCYSSDCYCLEMKNKIIFTQNISNAQCSNATNISSFIASTEHMSTYSPVLTTIDDLDIMNVTEIRKIHSHKSAGDTIIETMVIVIAATLFLFMIFMIKRSIVKWKNNANIAREDGEDGIEGDALDMQQMPDPIIDESVSSNLISWVPVPQNENEIDIEMENQIEGEQ